MLLVLNVLRQAVVAGELENEVRFVDLRVFVKGDQLIDQVALNLLKNVRLIQCSLCLIHVRCIADFDHNLTIRLHAAVGALQMCRLNGDKLNVLGHWVAKIDFCGAALYTRIL